MLTLYTRMINGVGFGITCEEDRVYSTSFAGSIEEASRSLLETLPFRMPFQFASDTSALAEATFSILEAIYNGRNSSGTVPLTMDRLPAYTQRVLCTVSNIPVGYVASYGGVAEAAGGGARAVGNVMAANPFAPIVPCHRVVSSSLGLGGYGGGLRRKFEFLNREKRGYTEQKEILVNLRRLRVFPVESVLRKFAKPVSGRIS